LLNQSILDILYRKELSHAVTPRKRIVCLFNSLKRLESWKTLSNSDSVASNIDLTHTHTHVVVGALWICCYYYGVCDEGPDEYSRTVEFKSNFHKIDPTREKRKLRPTLEWGDIHNTYLGWFLITKKTNHHYHPPPGPPFLSPTWKSLNFCVCCCWGMESLLLSPLPGLIIF